MKKKKVLVISKSEEDPSAFYRLIQYLKDGENVRCVNLFSDRAYRKYYNCKKTILEKALTGIWVDAKVVFVLLWDSLFYRSQVLVINRKLFPRYCPRFLSGGLKRYLEGKYVIWDFDDNIFQNGEISTTELRMYEDTADKVVVTNEFLKGLLCTSLQKKTDLLPTTDRDFEMFPVKTYNCRRKALLRTKINLIWTGTGGNLVFLEQIAGQLEQAAKEIKDKEVTLYVVSNLPFQAGRTFRYLKIRNVRWTRDGARKLFADMHIGLMPLKEDAFTKGKGAFKAVQYIGAGLPVVASPVGYNCAVVKDGKNGFLTDSRWAESIQFLTRSLEEWEMYSLCARKHWEENFNSRKNLKYWKNVLNR